MFNYQNFKVMRNVCGLDEHKDNFFVCIDKKMETESCSNAEF